MLFGSGVEVLPLNWAVPDPMVNVRIINQMLIVIAFFSKLASLLRGHSNTRQSRLKAINRSAPHTFHSSH